MWGDKTAESLERLQQQPFFEVGYDETLLMLTPTMINYIESNMDISSKQDYMGHICDFYKDILKNFYQ